MCSSTRICDVSEYLRMVDSRLFNSIQRPSHCLSQLLQPEKQHSLYAQITFVKCKRSFIPQFLFLFSLIIVFSLLYLV